MKDEEQSRAEFIEKLRGPVRIAAALDLSSHSVVCNWRKNGFPHVYKQALIDLARSDRITPHPELYSDRKTWKRNPATPLSLFINHLAANYGGFEELQDASGIPQMSLKSMRQRTKNIMLKHVPALEEAAKEVGVPLPEGWSETRKKYDEWAERKKSTQKAIDTGEKIRGE